MAGFVYVLLIFAMVGHSSGANWCICKGGSDAVLQKTLDYACGAGADCNPIHQSGPCFSPNTVKDHCNYAVNSYFQKKGQATGSCDFAGTAMITQSNPSSNGCSYLSSASGTPGITTTTGTPGATTTSGSTPLVTTQSPGAYGGVNSGLGPGASNPDLNGSGKLQQKMNVLSSSLILVLSGLVFWWA